MSAAPTALNTPRKLYERLPTVSTMQQAKGQYTQFASLGSLKAAMSRGSRTSLCMEVQGLRCEAILGPLPCCLSLLLLPATPGGKALPNPDLLWHWGPAPFGTNTALQLQATRFLRIHWQGGLGKAGRLRACAVLAAPRLSSR